MSASHLAAAVLLAAGCTVTVLASAAMLWTTRLETRLHLLAPVTSLGAPLVVAALVVTSGATLGSGLLVLIGVLAFLVGPSVGMATARAGALRARSTSPEPE